MPSLGAGALFTLKGLLLIVFVLLVDRVVSEVHEEIGKVALVGRDVLVGCQPAEAFFEEVHAQGVDAAYHHVDTQVEFQLVD